MCGEAAGLYAASCGIISRHMYTPWHSLYTMGAADTYARHLHLGNSTDIHKHDAMFQILQRAVKGEENFVRVSQK